MYFWSVISFYFTNVSIKVGFIPWMLHLLSLYQTSRPVLHLWVWISIYILSLTKIQGLWADLDLGFSGCHACFPF